MGIRVICGTSRGARYEAQRPRRVWPSVGALVAAFVAALLLLAPSTPSRAQDPAATFPLVWPVTGEVISIYNQPRGGGSRLHDGYDFAAPADAPVHASAAGTVVRVQEQKRGYGKLVDIEHGNGYRTLYAHLNAQSVSIGQRVERGQVIGRNGDTGNASGGVPHVHWELRRDPQPSRCPPRHNVCAALDLNPLIDFGEISALAPIPVPLSRIPEFPAQAGAPQPDRVFRLAGGSRIETAVEVSKATFAEDRAAGHVFVASAESWPDALAGAAMAGAFDGSLLLTKRAGPMEPSVRRELRRVLAPRGTAWFMGGTAAMPRAKLAGAGERHRVRRVGGGDRYGTTALAAGHVANHRGRRTAVLASGSDYVDALPMLAAAAANDWPVVLTPGDRLGADAERFLRERQIDTVHAAGPEGKLSARVVNEVDALPRVTTVERHFGATRHHTSAAVANRFFEAPRNFVVATGANWPDALVAAPYAGNHLGAPVLLAQSGSLTGPVADYVRGRRTPDARALVAGGTQALTEPVEGELEALLP